MTRVDVVGTRAQIAAHFQDAQLTLTNHRKNSVSLFRIHTACAAETEQTPRGTRLVGEKVFNDAFFSFVDRILVRKKGDTHADRALKFVSTYIAYAQEHFRTAATRAGAAEDSDTPATRLVTILIKHLLKGFHAKDKNVRLRSCTCVSMLISTVEAVDDDVYEMLSGFLQERVADKEASVRVQAVVALARLQMEEDSAGTTAMLLHVMRHDPSADVRRAALLNVPLTPQNLPHLLERLQDVDAANRRCVYLGVLKTLLDEQPKEDVDGVQCVTSLGLGEAALAEVVKTGMHEREESVRRAARKLAHHWLKACGNDLLLLLEELHVSTSGNGEPVLLALIEDHAEVQDAAAKLVSQREFWTEMSPERAVLARCLIQYLRAKSLDARIEECMPPVTALAFTIQREYEALSDMLEQQAAEELEEDMPAIQDARSEESVFVLEELLTLAIKADFGDESGRRKMFALVREMLANAWLPGALIPRCLDVLLGLSAGQRDFVQMVVELVQALEDDSEAAEAPGAADTTQGVPQTPARDTLSWQTRLAADTPAQTAQRAALDARRLVIVRAMLERVASSMQDNVAFHGLIPQLIVPAVKSKDATIREQGLACLGLCSLLDAQMALDTFPLLLDQIQRAEGEIRQRCIECMFDLLVVHGVDVLVARSAQVATESEYEGDEVRGLQFARQQLLGFLLGLLEDDDPVAQATAAEGFAKLLLTGVVTSDDVVKSLVLIYMSPDTADNQALRQCLSYFLPLFCSSHARHQRIIERVFYDVFEILAEAYDARDADTQMVSPAQVAMQLAEWSSPERLVEGLSERDELVHVDLAQTTLQRLFGIESRDLRRALGQMLSKLYFPAELAPARVRVLALLAAHVAQRTDDSVFRNALGRFGAVLEKRYSAALEGWNPEGAATDGTLDQPETEYLKSFLGALPPVLRLPSTLRATRSRRTASTASQSTINTWQEDEDEVDDEDDGDGESVLSPHPQVTIDQDELAI
ncbi:chromosome condensation complex Condensin, subunit G [Malassezia cuniculi]|uniref:Chromosome condensation complex Condensin, subunit G n=1 Tax=Malassezia cuniculi TaxID=948313 RepID=A0AAF0ETS6_9BASI|nr:chromosome condensation complex Condensin, subunit G [Malassezia cuniculi]